MPLIVSGFTTRVVLTTTDLPDEVDRCYALGCNVFINKPVEYDQFSEAVRRLGRLLSKMSFPKL